MTVEKLQNAYYVTGDMERAVAFYRDALGLDLMFQDGEKWTQFKAGGVNFAMASKEEAPDSAVGATIVFEVPDIDAARGAIENAGGKSSICGTWAITAGHSAFATRMEIWCSSINARPSSAAE